MAEWFYMSGGQQHGPVTAAQLKSLAASGGLVPEDLVWNQSMPEWVPARRVRGLPFAGMAQGAKPAPATPARAAAHAVATSAPVRAAPPAEAEPPAQPFLSESPAAPAEYAAAPVPSPNHAAQPAPARVDQASAARANTYLATKPVPAGAPVHAVELFAKTRTPLRLISFLTFLLMLATLAAGGFAGLVQFDKARKVLKDSVLSQIDDAVMPQKVVVDKNAAGKSVALAHTYRIPTDMEFMAVAGFYAFVAFILMIKLMSFSSKIRKLRATFGAEELERAVKSQTSLWRFLAMVVLITIAAGAVAYVRYVREIRWW